MVLTFYNSREIGQLYELWPVVDIDFIQIVKVQWFVVLLPTIIFVA